MTRTELDYLGSLWSKLREVYDLTMPATMPEKLRRSVKVQISIREARHAIHEAMSHIGDASTATREEKEES